MNILITNDDGYDSEGIISLYQVFGKDEREIIDRLLVVAPDRERSVSGHSITYQIPVRIKDIYKNGKMEIYSCSGSPADCVIIAHGYLEKKIDLIISGINRGANLGMDLTISGTFSAIVEGYVYGIPGIAVSLFQYNDPDYTFASLFTYEFVNMYRNYISKYKNLLININFPPFYSLDSKNFPIVTYQSNFRHVAYLEQRIDPRQNQYFWIYWKKYIFYKKENFQEKIQKYYEDEKFFIDDIEAIFNNHISITPILLDFNVIRSNSKLEKFDGYDSFEDLYFDLRKVLLEISKDAYKIAFSKIENLK